MDNQIVEKIITAIVAFLSTTSGVAFITGLIKAIVSSVTAYKSKKVSKLNEEDENRIAIKSSNLVINSIKDGITIEADAMIEKATNRRLEAVESKFNDIAKVSQQQMEVLMTLAQVVLELKSPSLASRERLANVIGASIPRLNSISIPEQSRVTARVDETSDADYVSKEKETEMY